MISHKVLITLTVIFIISCSGSPTLEDCEDYLKNAGFSNEFGYLNYCFAMQFAGFKQFQEYLKEVYNTTSTVINEILKAFFEDSKNHLKADDDLNDPETFCYLNKVPQSVLNYVPFLKHQIVKLKVPQSVLNYEVPQSVINYVSFLKPKTVKFDDPKVTECAGKITCTDDGKYDTSVYEVGEIVKINKDGNIVIANIEYGENIFKNAIKSHNLSLHEKSIITDITGGWDKNKTKYYEDQMKTLRKKNKSKFFLTTTKWCEKKRAEAKAAKENMATGKAAENVGHVHL